MKNKLLATIALAVILSTTTACSSDPAPEETKATQEAETAKPSPKNEKPKEEPAAEEAPKIEPAPTEPPPPAEPTFDLATDEGLCAADAAMTNFELNDAIAPGFGFSANREARSVEEDDAIRAYKNAAFNRACPERASEPLPAADERSIKVTALEMTLNNAPQKQELCQAYAAVELEVITAQINSQITAGNEFPSDVVQEVFTANC